MGLFQKKSCAFCNKQIGFLDAALLSYHLADGTYLCSDCKMASCSSLPNLDWTKSKTKEQILEHMEEIKKMKEVIANEFHVTDVITEYNNPSRILMSIDRDHRWWMVPDKPNDLLSFDHISEISVRIEHGDRHDVIRRKEYIPPRPDMPQPYRDMDLHGMKLDISIEKHPYAMKAPITLKICTSGPGLMQPYQEFLDEVYGYGAKCLDLMDSLM